jgi:hypothetical protein
VSCRAVHEERFREPLHKAMNSGPPASAWSVPVAVMKRSAAQGGQTDEDDRLER